MLGAILGNSTNSIALPESPFIGQIHYELFDDNNSVNSNAIVDRISNYFRFKHWNLDLDVNSLIRHNKLSSDNYRDLVENLITEYGKRNNKPELEYWIEHSPWNTRTFPTLDSLFPDSLFIHLVRDGRGQSNSILPLDWGPNNIITAAHSWAEDLAYGFNAELSLDSNRCIRVHYEDIIEEPKREIEKICSYFGLEFNEAMIEGLGLKLPSYTKRQHKLVGQAPQKSRGTAWQNSLTKRQIKTFEDIAGSLLTQLGYELTQPRIPDHPNFNTRLYNYAYEFLRQELINPIRRKKRRRIN